jgi:N-acylneuraminate cytidylyltransferase
MIGAESVLAIIPARGGSKRLPRKNLREFAGRPLIAWTIEAGKRSRYLDRIMLSSEDEEIMRVARSLGCEVPFARPAEFATDDAPGIAPVLDALARLPGYAWVVLLQPTSPLRSGEDIDACIDACVRLRAPACVSVAPVPKSPYWMYTLDTGRRLKPLIAAEEPRDPQPAFVLNGAVYVARTDWLLAKQTFVDEATVAHVMPPERSVDIDDETDFKFAQLLFRETSHGTL